MTTGTLMYDIQVETSDQEELESNLRKAIMSVKGVKDCECVDSDLVEDGEEDE